MKWKLKELLKRSIAVFRWQNILSVKHKCIQGLKWTTNIHNMKWIVGGLAYTYIAVMGGRYLTIDNKRAKCQNALYLEPSNMHLSFQKDVIFKIVDGKFENEVWYQEGRPFYSEEELNPNLPRCEIDLRKTSDREISQPITMNAGYSVQVASSGMSVISEDRGMNMIFISDFASNHDGRFNEDVAFYYVDCFIPTEHLADNFNMNIENVSKITAGVVRVAKKRLPGAISKQIKTDKKTRASRKSASQ